MKNAGILVDATMNYFLMPLDAHADSGFGAIAEAFRDAAKTLREAKPKAAFFEHLPQSFLFRHAVELFLKSEIVILHRKLSLPYGTKTPDDIPMIQEGSKWIPMFRVHSIGVLFSHWRSLIDSRLNELKDMTKYKCDWTVDSGADQWASVIDAIDPRSTYSRYPSMRDPDEDRSKSPFKETAKEDLFPQNAPPERAIMALVVEDQDREFVRAYVNEKNEEQDKEYLTALESMCEMLFNYHAMMRFELTDGF